VTKHLLPDSAPHHGTGYGSAAKGVGALRAGNSVLDRGGVSAGRAGKQGQDALAAARPSAAGSVVAAQDGAGKQVREWLLLLLRFAITLDPEDRLAVLLMANGFDHLARQCGRSAPTYFRRSSHEICDAITTLDDPRREAILDGHIARIGHPRLRRAFQAAVYPQRRTLDSSREKQPDLWTGVRR
jgi:hypothetical protein